MTRPETAPEDITSTTETIERGSLEWFRAHAPLPLVLRALFDDPDYRLEFGLSRKTTAESACEDEPEIIGFQTMAEILAERFECFDDPNAKEIVSRLRKLTGCKGRLRPVD
jgi:hypothetical protein